jgi:hypothetical protein
MSRIQASSGKGGDVEGIPPTVVNDIAVWADTEGTLIKNSLASVQALGDVHGQLFVTQSIVPAGTITLNYGEVAIAPGLTLEAGALIKMLPGSRIILE